MKLKLKAEFFKKLATKFRYYSSADTEMFVLKVGEKYIRESLSHSAKDAINYFDHTEWMKNENNIFLVKLKMVEIACHKDGRAVARDRIEKRLRELKDKVLNGEPASIADIQFFMSYLKKLY